MVISLTLALSGLLATSLPSSPATDETSMPPLEKLRSTDARTLAMVEDGYRRSPTFARLVDAIERSDKFVYVERVGTLSHGMRGCLLHGGAGPRYIRVLLRRGLPRDQEIEVLGHELQHVREVLDADVANDPIALAAFFDRIHVSPLGSSSGDYETAEARRVGSLVARELRNGRRARD